MTLDIALATPDAAAAETWSVRLDYYPEFSYEPNGQCTDLVRN